MQRQPLVRLLDRVVVKLGVHAPRAQRLQQIAPDIFGRLARVNGDVDDGRHELVVAEIADGNKPCWNQSQAADWLFPGAGQDRLEMWRLFLPGDDADFNVLEPRLLQPALQIAFGEAEPSITVQLPGILELMGQEIQQ